jgi:transcriptional regulator with XRE-family HTH domain
VSEKKQLIFENRIPQILMGMSMSVLEEKTKIGRSTWYALQKNAQLQRIDVKNLCALLEFTQLPLNKFFNITEESAHSKGENRLGKCVIPQKTSLTLISKLPSLTEEKKLTQKQLMDEIKRSDQTIKKYYYGYFRRLEIDVILDLMNYLECDFCQLFQFIPLKDKDLS